MVCYYLHRLGHFAENTNIYLSEKQLGKHDFKEKLFLIYFILSKNLQLKLRKCLKEKCFFYLIFYA